MFRDQVLSRVLLQNIPFQQIELLNYFEVYCCEKEMPKTKTTIPVIFEDENILIINKPSGLVVHPFDYSTERTLLTFLKKHTPEMFTIKNTITLQDKRVIKLGGVVHKLDRDTSGIMVVAKNQETFNELQKQFLDHTTLKTYLALVEGIVAEDSFTIDAPLGRSKKDYKQKVNPSNPRGELRQATTDVKVIARNVNITKSSTFVELTPQTGRTHQLRAHMSHVGHPIVGDTAYGATHESKRIMLHSKTLSFQLKGVPHSFSTNDDFITKII